MHNVRKIDGQVAVITGAGGGELGSLWFCYVFKSHLSLYTIIKIDESIQQQTFFVISGLGKYLEGGRRDGTGPSDRPADLVGKEIKDKGCLNVALINIINSSLNLQSDNSRL